MSRGYRELVGLQAEFNKDATVYSLTHFYQWKQNGEKSHVLTMQGYDMALVERAESVMDSLRTAYAPAVLSIWQQHTEKGDSEYLQFQVGATPQEVSLPGEWAIVAEW